jgi:hypothetical protein
MIRKALKALAHTVCDKAFRALYLTVPQLLCQQKLLGFSSWVKNLWYITFGKANQS